MTRSLTFIAPLLVAVTAAALVAPTAASASGAACVPGKTTVGGKSAMRFCGTAKAVAKAGSKTFTFSGGSCVATATTFTVNIGTLVINPVAGAKPGPTSYFGATVAPPKAGPHLTQPVTWTSGGKAYSVLGNTVTLKKGLKSGTFTGKSLAGAKVTGSFTC